MGQPPGFRHVACPQFGAHMVGIPAMAVCIFAQQAQVIGNAPAQVFQPVGHIQPGHLLKAGTHVRCRCRSTGTGLHAGTRQPLQKLGIEHGRIDGLGQMIVHAGVETALPVFTEGIGGHGDNRHLAPQLADRQRSLDAIHHRHLHVHQDQRVGASPQLVDSHRPVVGQVHLQTHVFQQGHGYFLVDPAVFNQEHPGPAVMAGQRGLVRLLAGGAGHIPDSPRKTGLDHVVQARHRHRLGKHSHRPQPHGSLPLGRIVAQGQQNAARRTVQVQVRQMMSRLETVHIGHLPVKERHFKGIAIPLCRRQHGQRRLTRLAGDDPRTQCRQHRGQGIAGLAQIVHHQHADRQHPRCGRHGPIALAEPGSKPEVAAVPRFAFDTGLTAHQTGQMAGNRQAQAGAAKAPGGRTVSLLERLEKSPHHVRLDADAAIADIETDLHGLGTFVIRTGPQQNHAGIGELHRIAQIIDQHLAEACRIAAQQGRHPAHVHHQLQSLLMRPIGHQCAGLAHHVLEVELGFVETQLAGFNF